MKPPIPKKKEELIKEIKGLCRSKNALILAHYYQDDEIQEIAHFIGDSLELSRKAANTDAEIIVFCGVHFMAETAKILSPEKTVLIPDLEAGCSLADECQEDDFKHFIDSNPDHYVISYINCTAAVKAQSDLICTSSNAVDLVKKIPKDQKIIFAPDKNLGKWVENQSGRKMKLWEGSCIVHESFSEEAVVKLKLKYPNAKVIAHPECQQVLLEHADYIGSTSKLLNYAQESNSDQFIVLTEPGILFQMKKNLPKKIFIEVPNIEGCSCNKCPYMRLNTLDKVISCLRNMKPQIHMEESTRMKALSPIKKMLEMSK